MRQDDFDVRAVIRESLSAEGKTTDGTKKHVFASRRYRTQDPNVRTVFLSSCREVDLMVLMKGSLFVTSLRLSSHLNRLVWGGEGEGGLFMAEEMDYAFLHDNWDRLYLKHWLV